MHHIFLAGWPKTVGGGNTEAWHTIRLWLKHGCHVTVIPTWTASEPTRARLAAMGAEVCCASPETLSDVPGLSGAIVVAFANERFVEEAHRFKAMGCRIAWASCMCWTFDAEREHYRRFGLFDSHICQSEFQRAKITPHLRCPDYHGGMLGNPPVDLIPGAFCLDDWPFEPRPHRPGERFVVGRLSRAAPEKFPAGTDGPMNLWAQYARIPYPTSARVMGWSERVEERVGPPPKWAEVLPENAETTREFLGKIHALVPGWACCDENWPRVGLEAMACGVPVVAHHRGGWIDMLAPEQRDGERVVRKSVGDLCRSVDEQAYFVARLAHDEQFRMSRIMDARWELENTIAPEGGIWERWHHVFERLTCKQALTV